MSAVRPAIDGDLDAIARMLRAAALPTEDLDASAIEFLVLEAAGRLVGAVGLERFGATGLLRSLVVDQAHRGGGRGAALVRALERRARDAGIGELVLLTQTAEAFFEARGYAAIARDEAPASVRASAEFRSLCPASAVCMRRRL